MSCIQVRTLEEVCSQQAEAQIESTFFSFPQTSTFYAICHLGGDIFHSEQHEFSTLGQSGREGHVEDAMSLSPAPLTIQQGERGIKLQGRHWR